MLLLWLLSVSHLFVFVHVIVKVACVLPLPRLNEYSRSRRDNRFFCCCLRVVIVVVVFFSLDASSHLYMRSCPSVGRMDGRMDGWLVTRFFFFNAENEPFSI